MTTGRETTGSDKRGIELILLCLTTYETDDGTDVVDLSRPLGIHAAAVIRTNHSITSLQQGINDGTEVGSTLAVVAEPRTTIDMNHHGIAGSLFLRQIDVAGMECLVIACIVHILPFLGGFEIRLWSLEAAKASETTLGLCRSKSCKAHQNC